RAGEDGRHIGPTGGAAVAAGVVGGQPPALLELSPPLVHRRRVNRLGRVLREVAEQQAAFRGRRNLTEVQHGRGVACRPLRSSWSASSSSRLAIALTSPCSALRTASISRCCA